MKYNNRLYPHPVLGIEDDIVNAKFECELGHRSDNESIVLNPIFHISEESLTKLISDRKAIFVVHVYCRATFFRKAFSSVKQFEEPIKIVATSLRGEVEVDFFICSTAIVDKYTSENFNPDYKKTSFSLEPADILAYGGKAKFFANKTPDELKSVSSLIRIQKSNESMKPMKIEYDSEKIEVQLCEEDYYRYQLIIKRGNWSNIMHSSIVLPVLIDALYILDGSMAPDYENRRWYKALMELKVKAGNKRDNFSLAQSILDMPGNRTFETIALELE